LRNLFIYVIIYSEVLYALFADSQFEINL